MLAPRPLHALALARTRTHSHALARTRVWRTPGYVSDVGNGHRRLSPAVSNRSGHVTCGMLGNKGADADDSECAPNPRTRRTPLPSPRFGCGVTASFGRGGAVDIWHRAVVKNAKSLWKTSTELGYEAHFSYTPSTFPDGVRRFIWITVYSSISEVLPRRISSHRSYLAPQSRNG
eukprot:8638914-Pyramimonas_sp.AAC.1